LRRPCDLRRRLSSKLKRSHAIQYGYLLSR
jgi:hypothetical protein